ncbi:neuroglobin [Nematostella vectensis]|uniref:neuroglobin n=1 Tax=Nematostella vectensis TaxID=45351 RepID=UPI0020774E53|nr:neuroglobin [Nematostella vectensis]
MARVLDFISSLLSLLFGDIWKGLLMSLLGVFSTTSKRVKPHVKEAPLTERQIQLIQDSWTLVENQKQEAGIKLFTRLFKIAPYIRDLFPFGYDPASPGLKTHALGVMDTVEVAVRGLDDQESLALKLVELGQFHKRFGLTNQEFEHVGSALLWTLETSLGDKFTADTKQAWTDAYTIIQGAMEQGLK